MPAAHYQGNEGLLFACGLSGQTRIFMSDRLNELCVMFKARLSEIREH